MSGRRPAIVAWGLCGLAVLAECGTVALAIADAGSLALLPDGRKPIGGVASGIFDFVLVGAFGVVGAVVASRRPRNPIGWFLSAIPTLLAFGLLGESIYWHAVLAHSTDALPAVLGIWVSNWWWAPAVYMVFVFLPLLFPTGRPPTSRWRIVAWVAAGGGLALFVNEAFSPGPTENYAWIDNPLGVAGLPAAIGWIGMAVWAAASLAALASLVVRFRRSHGTERQQLKWLTAAVPLLVVMWVVSTALQGVMGEDGSWAIMSIGLLGVDLAVALAIMRYRLYDIDVVINRALVYSALTATLAGTYLGSVLVLQLVLSGVAGDSGLAVAASTLAVAAVFRPARSRIQQLVDRRFYRRKYDAQQTLEAFAVRLRDEVALDALSAELRGVVVDTMQPAHLSLWLREAPR